MVAENRGIVVEKACTAIDVPLCFDDDDRVSFLANLETNHVTVKQKKPEQRKDENEDFAENFGPFFYKVAGEDEVVDAYELKSVMEMIFARDYGETTNKSFSLETCRCLVGSIDKNRRGSLSYDQFKRLWFAVMEWKDLFEACDENQDRKIDRRELRLAVSKLNYRLSSKTLDLIACRYGNRQGTINLDDFCTICSKLQALATSFEHIQNDRKLNYEHYLMEWLYS